MDTMNAKWTKCCRGRANCPSIKIAKIGDVIYIFIKDDYGVIVQLTEDQYHSVVETVSRLKHA